MKLRAISMLLATALIVIACSGNASPPTPTPPVTQTPAAAASSQLESPTLSASGQPSASPHAPIGSADSLPPETPVATGTDGPGATEPTASEVAGSATPKPSKAPKPLPAYVIHGKRNGDPKVIALTMDADMYPWMYADRSSYTEYDPRVIQLLESSGIHATIFANGLYVKAYPDVIKSLSKQPGIEIGNHSWDHGYWPGCQAKDPAASPIFSKSGEITEAAQIIQKTVGYKPDWFRFGGFCYGDPSNLELVKSLGEWPVGVDCFFGDSAGWSAAKQIANVQNTCSNGSIVVTHLDNTRYHPDVYEALKALIPWWKKNGWQVVNVTELMGQSPPNG